MRLPEAAVLRLLAAGVRRVSVHPIGCIRTCRSGGSLGVEN